MLLLFETSLYFSGEMQVGLAFRAERFCIAPPLALLPMGTAAPPPLQVPPKPLCATLPGPVPPPGVANMQGLPAASLGKAWEFLGRGCQGWLCALPSLPASLQCHYWCCPDQSLQWFGLKYK